MKLNATSQAQWDRLQSYLQQNRTSLPAINQAAQLLQQSAFPLDNALLAYQAFLERQPSIANAAFNYAWYLAKNGQFEMAIDQYRRALSLGVAQPEEAHLNIANIYMDHLHSHELAEAEFESALAINPRYAGAYHNLGNLAEQLGNREEAALFFEKCLAIDPGNESALARLSDTHRFQDKSDPLLTRLESRALTSRNSDLHFALGSAFNQLADYDSAWRHFSTANDLDRATLPTYNGEKTESWFKQIRAHCNADWINGFGGESDSPVFICGMFRTGSTLLEQVLAAHPGFTAGGESEFIPRLVLREFHDYPFGMDEIAPDELRKWRNEETERSLRLTNGKTRLTDKRPDNFLFLGLIRAILPSAKFVVTERDWRDTALSIFSTRLGTGQNYATRLADIRHYIGLQSRLIDHWESTLGEAVQRIRYEDLATQPRDVVGRLLTGLGEQWDDRCLSFDKLDNAVKTASVWQVREPLHSRSIGRWMNYRRYFEEIFGADLDA